MAPSHRRAVFPTTLVVVVALVLIAGLATWLLSGDVPQRERGPVVAAEPTSTFTPSPTPTPQATPASGGVCANPPAQEFAPRTITVAGVVHHAPVMGLPRDAAGVPGVPPTSAKHVFAWDRDGVQAGASEGHVLLNTHTHPDGSALGNALLAKLQEGDLMVLRAGPSAVCYRVSKRVQVLETKGYPGWAAIDGPPKVVIVVCSGKRLGPGRWTHRTLWFADPVRPVSERSQAQVLAPAYR
jgi:hypothetical protein